MPRRLRIEYPDAIYHVMSGGNARQDIVRDDADRRRLLECLGRTVTRCGRRLYAFADLTNRPHPVLKTPRPRLARGMQAFVLSMVPKPYVVTEPERLRSLGRS